MRSAPQLAARSRLAASACAAQAPMLTAPRLHARSPEAKIDHEKVVELLGTALQTMCVALCA